MLDQRFRGFVAARVASAKITAAPVSVSPGMSPSRERPSSPPSTARISASTASSWARRRRRSPSSPAIRRNRPRRDQPTASGSSSTASTFRAILPMARFAPQARAASVTRARNSCSPRPASRAGSPPHRDVTTSTQASQVTGLNGQAAAAYRRRPRHRQEVPDPGHRRRRRLHQLLTAPPQLPQQGPRPVQLLRHVAVQLARQPADQHRIGLIPLMRRVAAAPGRYATPAAARTPGPGPAARTAAAPASTAAPSARTPPSPR